MNRNQCIICFDRISHNKDKITTSHGEIKHNGWYHIECIKQHINHSNEYEVPKCPLCRQDFIIDIPNFSYNKTPTVYNTYNVRPGEVDNFMDEIRDETVNTMWIIISAPNIPRNIWIFLSIPNLILFIQGIIRYYDGAYFCIYCYVLYTSMVIFYSNYVNNNVYNRNRTALKHWLMINRTIHFVLLLEMIYSIINSMINSTINSITYMNEHDKYML